MSIKCFICGKKGKKENNISFYIYWIEYEPNKWLCRECKEKIIDSSLLIYKFSTFADHIGF